MQVLQAGSRQLVLLELDTDLISQIAQQCGFVCKVTDDGRTMVAELTAAGRDGPLLLFDATDPANLGWFSRCQFYVDGTSGRVLQTPFRLGNLMDRKGRAATGAIRIQVEKELPAGFRLPGRQQVSEQSVYAVLTSLLTALTETGIAICGGAVVKPLAGRTESAPKRN